MNEIVSIILINVDFIIFSGNEQTRGSRGLFSPRMQYDDWTPLGRGDPLKNDPTFDYVPPVLDKVQYWVPPAARTPDPPRTSTAASISSSTVPSTTTTSTPLKTMLAVMQDQLQVMEESYVQPAMQDRLQMLHDSSAPVMQDRLQDLGGITRIRQHYNFPVYYQYRPNHQRPPYTILVPPPPGKPFNYTPASPSVMSPTTSSVKDYWGTQLVTVAPATQVHNQKHQQSNLHIRPQQQLQQIDITSAPSVLHFLLNSELESSTTPPPPPSPTTITFPPTTAPGSNNPTTTMSSPSLTTDPLFSHYKQPVQPLKGPMYLIIQGHSKVKTYGPAKLDKISGIPIQETNEVFDDHYKKHRKSR